MISSQYVSRIYKWASSAKRKIGGIISFSSKSTSLFRTSSTTIRLTKGIILPMLTTITAPLFLFEKIFSNLSPSARLCKNNRDACITWNLETSASRTSSLRFHVLIALPKASISRLSRFSSQSQIRKNSRIDAAGVSSAFLSTLEIAALPQYAREKLNPFPDCSILT